MKNQKKNRVSLHAGKVGYAVHNLHEFKKDNKEIYVCDMFEGICEGDITETEIKAYEEMFGDWLSEQNEKYTQKRNYSRIKTMQQVYESKRYRPTETILQYGNVKSDNIPDADTYNRMVCSYMTKKIKHIDNYVLLNFVNHCDETVPHTHERGIWRYKDENGVWRIDQERGMEQAGIELPNPDEPVSRTNNRGMTYTAMCREWWQDTCEEFGYPVERVPLPRRRKSETVGEYQERMDREAVERAEATASKALQERERALQEREQALRANQIAQQAREDSLNAREQALNSRESNLSERERNITVEIAQSAGKIIERRMRRSGKDSAELSEIRENLSKLAEIGMAYSEAYKQSAQHCDRVQAMKPNKTNERVQALYEQYTANVVDFKPAWLSEIEGDNAREDNPHTPA